MLHRLEISLKAELDDPTGLKVLRQFRNSEWNKVQSVRTLQAYTFFSEQVRSTEQLQDLTESLFVDPVLDRFACNRFLGDQEEFDWYVEVGFRAGVTDNAGKVARENLELKLPQPFGEHENVCSSTGFFIRGDFSEPEINRAVDKLLMNKLIQRKIVISKSNWSQEKEQLTKIPVPHGDEEVRVETLDCSSVEKILQLSHQRVLALSQAEAEIIAARFQDPEVLKSRADAGMPSQPTDVELEAIAQTWSEHCKHKIFNADIRYTDEKGDVTEISSLYKSYIQKSTKKIRADLGDQDWCLSVFKDNAGVIRFNDDFNVAFKVETHNSPSALDPYGGAITGIVGVNRDSFGTGMGAKLICNTDVFCFGPPTYNKKLPEKLMHPTQIYEGVRLGVEHGGNQSGIPTVNGAIVFDDCFVGKPLVFCGTASIMPAKHEGKPAEDKEAYPGDRIVMVGGRIGKDGIHGATFSSVALDENSPVSAVQIGDPITQKRMFDFLWEAKKENLYTCITDNGAGGLSSSVGEMAEFSGGCRLELDRAPLKYDGLQPWEILISEAQERMTVAVPEKNLARFLEISEKMQVESTDLGVFTDSGYFECLYQGKLVAHLKMDFLHKGLPAMKLAAQWQPSDESISAKPQAIDYAEMLHRILARPNVCSKESVIRQYDHEVQGGSVIKPLIGPDNDGPGDSGVIRPVLDSMMGLAISNGICPKYSVIDTYHMAACAIDEAIRNVIAVGGSLDQIAGLDNFCWPDPVQSSHTPDGEYKLAQLVRACMAIEEYCEGFGVPCISGKDSMKNDANLDGQKISILPTLLFSAMGVIQDVRMCVTSDVKAARDLVYLLGKTKDECGASEYYQEVGIKGGAVPKVDWKHAKELYQKVTKATEKGLIASNHDLSDGGLAVAAAESAFAGGFGIEINLANLQSLELSNDVLLFSESPSRFLVTVSPEHSEEFEAMMGSDLYPLGAVLEDPVLRIFNDEDLILSESLDDLKTSWKKTLNR